MPKQLPKKMFVKLCKDGSTEYFAADQNAEALVEMGKKVTIGTYQLVETSIAEGVAKLAKRRT